MKNLGKGGGANFPTLEARRYKHGSPANVTNPLLPIGQRAQEQNNTVSSLFLVQQQMILAPAMGLIGF